jgi:hypothetical protein
MLLDRSSYDHLIGHETLKGFIYQIGFYTTSHLEFIVFLDHTNCASLLRCKTCPPEVSDDTTPVCLIECERNEYISGDPETCQPCLEDCSTSGCTNGADCNFCDDSLCADCPNDLATCISCIPNSEKNVDGVCECIANYEFDETSMTCEPICVEECQECTEMT